MGKTICSPTFFCFILLDHLLKLGIQNTHKSFVCVFTAITLVFLASPCGCSSVFKLSQQPGCIETPPRHNEWLDFPGKLSYKGPDKHPD